MLELVFSFKGLDPESASRVVEIIRDVPGVENVSLANVVTGSDKPPHKGGLSDVIAQIAPGALQRIGAALAALFGLPGAPLGTIEVGTPHGPARMDYDPRRQSLDEVVTQMLRLTSTQLPAG